VATEISSVRCNLIHLKEPIHSGEYLADLLRTVTDDFDITSAVFTITRDNASSNSVMLEEFEKYALLNFKNTLQQPWHFLVEEGDVRCIAHIINIAVQAALTSLKSVPSKDCNIYRFEEGVQSQRIPNEEALSAMLKLTKHIYVFRSRRAWKDALSAQAIAMDIQPIQLVLDMPFR
jgi:hypothetical protein